MGLSWFGCCWICDVNSKERSQMVGPRLWLIFPALEGGVQGGAISWELRTDSCFSWEGRETSVVLNWHEATIVYIMCIYLYTIQISFIFYCGLYKNTRNVFQLAASFCMFFLALGSPQGVLRSKATANCKSFRPEFASGDPGARWTWTRLSL